MEGGRVRSFCLLTQVGTIANWGQGSVDGCWVLGGMSSEWEGVEVFTDVEGGLQMLVTACSGCWSLELFGDVREGRTGCLMGQRCDEP